VAQRRQELPTDRLLGFRFVHAADVDAADRHPVGDLAVLGAVIGKGGHDRDEQDEDARNHGDFGSTPDIEILGTQVGRSDGYVSPVAGKDGIRKEIWKAMDREGVSRFPGAEGRIPNFAGARLAAEKLAGNRLWKRARVIKANPDSPQTHARRTALEEGKTLIMAVPRLRDPHPFRVLEPKRLSKAAMKEAATIKGALKHGRVVALDDLPEIDFVLTGSVAVNLSGARIGKGGGYNDLEYGILIDAGKIDDHTTIATTVHPIQIVRRHLPVISHDLPVDLIATPRAVIEVERQYERPRGILWDHLQPPQIREIPVLERMGYA